MTNKVFITGASAALAAIVALGGVAAPIVQASSYETIQPRAAIAAAAATSGPTGFFRDGVELTAKQIGGVVTGDVDATGFDIAVYNPARVVNANIHGAKYYGVVVNGLTNVNTTGSRIHQIGDSPFDGMQRGRAILYINGATGTIGSNKVYAFQKNGIEVRGLTADATANSTSKTSARVINNVITGRGHIGDIAQNGIVIMGNAGATLKNNIVSHLWYTGTETYATGLLNVDVAPGKVVLTGNKFLDTQVRIDGVVTVNVTGSSNTTVRPHGVRVDLRSDAKPAAQVLLGTKLDWKIKVDGKSAFHVKEGFGARDTFVQNFATGSGRHVVKVFKNDVLVRTAVVRA